ncbi:TRAP transporter large permease subunit [Chloroflexota bacterium]
MTELYFIPIIMFGSLLVVIIAGIPLAFATSGVAIVCAYMLWGHKSIAVIVSHSMGTMSNWILVAVPLFIFMAMVLDKTGVIADIYDSFHKWLGSLRGGLAAATTLVGAMMGAMTGIAAGTVSALGLIALPQMLKYKYNKNIAIGSVLVGGTLGQLIPPSTLMIVYGAITGVSVGGLFAGGMTCGLMLAAIFCFFILVASYFKKDLCPIPPPEGRVGLREKFTSSKGIVLPVLLIMAVLGSIFSGMATPTEASAVGCIGALICALVKRTFRWSSIMEASMGTLKITAMVGWITIGALIFGGVFTAVGGDKLILEISAMLPLGRWGAFIMVMVVILFLGMFLDTVAIIVICAPLFSPLAIQLGFDPLWFGLTIMVNLQAAYLTPPFGYSLFYVKAIAPGGVTLEDIYRASLPFVALQLVGLVLVVVFPPIATWLPSILIK